MPFHPDGPSFGDHSWWASGGWHIVPLILFAVLIGVIVWAVLRLTSTSSGGPRSAAVSSGDRHDGALEEVRVRYARGEMSREEFTQRFRDLGGAGIEALPPTEPTPPAA